MKRNEWYQTAAWDPVARGEFDRLMRRIKGAYRRTDRYQTKANALRRTGDAALLPEALFLLERALSELKLDEVQLRAQLLEDIGSLRLALGEKAQAVSALRRCIETADIFTRKSHGCVCPEERVARALIEEGRLAEARALLDLFHRYHHPIPTYQDCASRVYLSVDGEPYVDPEEAAEAIVVQYHAAEDDEPAMPEIFEGDIAALEALDRRFQFADTFLSRPFAPRVRYTRQFLEERFLAELGAFVGRVLCRSCGGRWETHRPLMHCRVSIGSRKVDPFLAAYDAVFYEMPLIELIKTSQAPRG